MDFETGYEVTIARPVAEVFPVLALEPDLERVLRLSPLVTHVDVLGTEPGDDPSTQVITFEFAERVPMPAGLLARRVTMRVEQTVDTDGLRVDYWSQTKGGTPVSVHKVRTFEEVAGGTKVSETIHGQAAPGVHVLVRRAARRAHIQHMNSYASLFPGE